MSSVQEQQKDLSEESPTKAYCVDADNEIAEHEIIRWSKNHVWTRKTLPDGLVSVASHRIRTCTEAWFKTHAEAVEFAAPRLQEAIREHELALAEANEKLQGMLGANASEENLTLIAATDVHE